MLIVCFLHKIDLNPQKKIFCCGKTCPKIPLFDLLFLGVEVGVRVGEFVGFMIYFFCAFQRKIIW